MKATGKIAVLLLAVFVSVSVVIVYTKIDQPRNQQTAVVTASPPSNEVKTFYLGELMQSDETGSYYFHGWQPEAYRDDTLVVEQVHSTASSNMLIPNVCDNGKIFQIHNTVYTVVDSGSYYIKVTTEVK